MSARPHTALPLERPAGSGRPRSPSAGVRTWSGAGLLPSSHAAGADVVVVVEGVVSVSLVLPSGRVIGLAILGPGEVWAAPAGDGGLAAFRVEALCPSRVRLLVMDTLVHIASAAEVAGALVRMLLHRAADAERRYAGLAALPVEERVLSLLRKLGRLRGEPVADGVRVELDLSQERIASLTGATRESVNRAVRALKRAGILRREGLRYEVTGGGS